jgi:transposase
MELVSTHCAGLDVHKKIVVACVRILGTDGKPHTETRTFSTMTADLLALADWLLAQGVTQVAMESTGEYWKPIYAILEPQLTVMVVNAQHIKQVPGRKTDVKDAAWIAELLAHGLLRPSFIPPAPQRDLRDLTRQRTTLIHERAAVVNRLQKVLEWANIKLAAVATDVTGKSARSMLEAIVDGQSDATALAELAKGRMRAKREALEQALAGRIRSHHRFMIARHLEHIDFLDEQIATFDTQIAEAITAGALPDGSPPPAPDATAPPPAPDATAPPPPDAPSAPPLTGGTSEVPPSALTWSEAITIWDEIPGIGRRVAEQIVAEVGVDLAQFRSAAHLASWAKLCPGTHESAGKRTSASIGKGNNWLRSTLVQAAHAAVRVKDSYLSAFYHRLVGRRGKKKALVAVAHKILVLAYTLIQKRERYRDPGATYLDGHRKDKLLHRLRRRIEQLGYAVSLEPMAVAAD